MHARRCDVARGENVFFCFRPCTASRGLPPRRGTFCRVLHVLSRPITTHSLSSRISHAVECVSLSKKLCVRWCPPLPSDLHSCKRSGGNNRPARTIFCILPNLQQTRWSRVDLAYPLVQLGSRTLHCFPTNSATFDPAPFKPSAPRNTYPIPIPHPANPNNHPSSIGRDSPLPPQCVAALPSCASSFPRSLATFSPPRPQQSSFLMDNHKAEIFGLALSSKALQGPWMRIYNSEEDGLSFNRWVVGWGGWA